MVGRLAGQGAGGLSGETDLAVLLRSMAPVLAPERYAYAPVDRMTGPPLGWLAMVNEAEGVSAVAPDEDGDWALISLTVHSALEAVGLTATISAALAARGISANVIAGLHHDHLLVPWDRRDDAMAALTALSATP